jgi:hypothetical protein
MARPAKPKFRQTYWQNYPEPFYEDWQSEPVPGWGARPVMAGPAKLGVGALTITKAADISRIMVKTPGGMVAAPAPPPKEEPTPKVPTYVWVMTGAFIIGGGIALVRNMGWIKRKGR